MRNASWTLRGRTGLAFAAAVVVALTAHADDIAYLTNNNNSSGETSFYTAEDWAVDGTATTEAPNSSLDYCVKNSYFLRTPENDASCTFYGKSLIIGEVGGTSGNFLLRTNTKDRDVTIANNGLVCRNGILQSWNGNTATINGTITIESPATTPFLFGGTAPGFCMDIPGPVVGASGTGIWLFSRAGNGLSTNFTCRFLNDALAGYNGKITSHWSRSGDYSRNANANYSQTFLSDTGTFPGTLDLRIGAQFGCVACTSVFEVANLQLAASNKLLVALSDNMATASLVRVTSSLTMAEPVSIAFREGPDDVIDASTTTTLPYGSLPILKAPSGATLDASLFKMDDGYDRMPHLPRWQLAVQTDASDGLSTLVLVNPDTNIVVMAGNDTYAAGTTSFTKAGQWSDGLAPSPGKSYLVGAKELRTPSTQSDLVFAGSSLTLNNNGTAFYVRCNSIRVDDFRLFGTCYFANMTYGSATKFADYYATGTHYLYGRIRAQGEIKHTCFPGRAWAVEAPISGSGVWKLNGSQQGGNTQPYNFVYGLLGDNSDYHGRFEAVYYLASPTNGTHVYFNTAANLGGPLDDEGIGLYMCSYSSLHPLQTVTLDDSTRGIQLGGAYVTFDVTNNVVFTCKERICYAGNLRKVGGGTLELGGPAPYFGSKYASGGTPGEGANEIIVAEGTLTPVSAAAFDGTAVVVSNGAHFVVNVPASNSDGDIGQYGILNTTWDAPITLANGAKVEFAETNGRTAPASSDFTVPICTVNATAAETLRTSLVLGSSPYDGYAMSLTWSENEDESVTFAAKFVSGLTVIIR